MDVITSLQARRDKLADTLATEPMTAERAKAILSELDEIKADLQKEMEFISDFGEAKLSAEKYGVSL